MFSALQSRAQLLQQRRPAAVAAHRSRAPPAVPRRATTVRTADNRAPLRPAAATAAPVAPASSSSNNSSSAGRPDAWQAWVACLPSWPTSSTLDKKKPNLSDREALAAGVAAAAASYKPKPSLKVPSLDDLGQDVPRDLHKRLELVAKVQLAGAMGVGIDALRPTLTVAEHTTSDIAAALSVASVTVAGKKAVVSLVATETERQATWSRLEGLILHWAVSRKAPPLEKWELPARGWKTLPDTTTDAGGAWSTQMEKHPLPSPQDAPASPPQAMYTAVVEVPLEGNLSTGGGVIFVLKSGGTGQKTRWLKDAATSKDFYVALH